MATLLSFSPQQHSGSIRDSHGSLHKKKRPRMSKCSNHSLITNPESMRRSHKSIQMSNRTGTFRMRRLQSNTKPSITSHHPASRQFQPFRSFHKISNAQHIRCILHIHQSMNGLSR
jgi:hypothetical protein